jgi:hypothetical protein
MKMRLTGGLTVLACMAAAHAETVRIPNVTYGTFVTTLVGRQGSVAGPDSSGVGPIGGAVPPAGGTFGASSDSSVGPVAPGLIVSLPGTTAIATSNASTFITVTPSPLSAPASTTIDISVIASQSVIMMDGGSYLSDGGGTFSVDVTVDEPTSYTLTGTLAMDSEDPLAYLQFVGQPVFITPAGNGPLSVSGELAPGTYTLRGFTSSRAPEFGVMSGDSLDGSSIQLTLTLAGRLGNSCDSIDFNNDGASFDPQDIDAFLSVFSEGPCVPDSATCNDIDFNNDGSLFDPCDIDAFLLVFSEGPCTACGE